MEKRFAGKFIVLDGPDGCGKTVQAELLTRWLQEHHVPTASLHDPGDTTIGEKIRLILLSPEHIAMSTPAEVLLYMAARAQLWQERIALALEANECVILDRWLSSTCAYQGYAGDFGIDNVIRIATDSLERVWPDLTVILDVDLKTASRRLNRELDRMERKGKGYHQKVRKGFLELANKKEDFVVVDAGQAIEDVHEKVLIAIRERF